MSGWTQCSACKHYQDGFTRSCAAFPKGIPRAVFLGYFDHRWPLKGDNGIRYEHHPDFQKIVDKAKRLGVEEPWPPSPPEVRRIVPWYGSERWQFEVGREAMIARNIGVLRRRLQRRLAQRRCEV
jgi:hypothetical protein